MTQHNRETLLALADRAVSEIAYVCEQRIAVRKAGFSDEALAFPRDQDGMVAICAFNGIAPEQAPAGWRYYPNAGTKKAWERVTAALRATASSLAEPCSPTPITGDQTDD